MRSNTISFHMTTVIVIQIKAVPLVIAFMKTYETFLHNKCSCPNWILIVFLLLTMVCPPMVQSMLTAVMYTVFDWVCKNDDCRTLSLNLPDSNAIPIVYLPLAL